MAITCRTDTIKCKKRTFPRLMISASGTIVFMWNEARGVSIGQTQNGALRPGAGHDWDWTDSHMRDYNDPVTLQNKD